MTYALSIKLQLFKPYSGEPMKSACLTTITLMVVTLSVAGCGGSSKPSPKPTQAAQTQAAPPPTQSTTGRPLTREQLIAQADAICYKVNVKLASTVITSQRDLAQQLPVLAATERNAAAALSKLVPPASMAADWKVIL